MPFAIIEGIRTHYQVAGEGPPLLLIEPFTDSTSIPERWVDRLWRGFKPTERLTRDFQLITYDRRESGRSGGRVEPLSWTGLARHADALLDHLAIERAFLLGGCIGSSVALALGALSPGRCRALLLHWPVGGSRWLNLGRSNFNRHITFAREHGLSRVIELVRQSSMFWSNPETGPWASLIATDDSFAQSFARQDLDRYLEVVAQSRDNLFNDDMPSGVTNSQLMTMQIPAFVMPGNDALHTTASAQLLCELMPHARLSPLMPRQQNAASIERWVDESTAARDRARPVAALPE